MIGIVQAPLLVLGATGTVGRGVIEAAVDAAWPVIAVARNAGELASLQRRHPAADITALCGSITGDDEAEQLAAAVRELGRPLGGVVVAVSSCANRGGLLEQATQALRCRLDTDLIPQLAAARAFLPLLARANRGGGYVVVGGPGSDRPWAGYGHRSIAAAGLRMLVSALHDEARPLGVRVQLLSVDAPAGNGSRDACPHWPTPAEIGRQALALLDGRNARGPARAVVPFVTRPDCAKGAEPAAGHAGRPPLTQRWLQDSRTLLASITGTRNDGAPARDPPADAATDAGNPTVSCTSPFPSPFPSDPHKEASP